MSQFFVAVSLLIIPFSVALADGGGPQNLQQVITILDRFQKWFATAFWIFAIGFAFYAAYLFLFSAQDAKKYDEAKRALLYTIIAMAVGILVYGLPALIQSILNP